MPMFMTGNTSENAYLKRLLALHMAILMTVSLAGCTSIDKDRRKAEDDTLPEAADLVIVPEEETETETIPEPEPVPGPAAVPDRSAEYIYDLHPKFTKVRYDSPALLGLTEDAGADYTDSLVFLCDSPTYWMGPNGLVPMEHIWTGPEGTQTLAYQSTYEILDPYDSTEKPIRQVVSEHKPEYLVIAIGINGISFMDETYFKDEYRDLVQSVQELSPETKIICQAIYPITKNYKYWGGITNSLITKGNSWILDVAEETGTYYLDAFAAILDENGQAKADLIRSDGLHPNREGLEVILTYIRCHRYPED